MSFVFFGISINAMNDVDVCIYGDEVEKFTIQRQIWKKFYVLSAFPYPQPEKCNVQANNLRLSICLFG